MDEMRNCPLCGAMPKLTAYRDGVWVDVSCSNPECTKYFVSFRSIQVAIKRWNEYARSTQLTKSAPEMYELLQLTAASLRDKNFCKTPSEKNALTDRIKKLLSSIDGEDNLEEFL